MVGKLWGSSSLWLFLKLIDSFSAERIPAEMRLERGKGADVNLIHFNKIRLYLKGKGKILQGFQQEWHDQIYVLETAFSCSVEDGLEVGDLRKGFGNNCHRDARWWRGRDQKVERTELGCLLFPLGLGYGGSSLFGSAASFQNWRAPHCVVLGQLPSEETKRPRFWLGADDSEAETTELPVQEAAQAATAFSFQKQHDSVGEGRSRMLSGALGFLQQPAFFLDH